MTYNKDYLKKVIPDWIKMFSVYFVIRAVFWLIAFVLYFFNVQIMQGENAIESNNIFTLPGLIISCFVSFKLVVAIGFLKAEKWSLKFAIIENAISLVFIVSLLAMMLMNFQLDFIIHNDNLIIPFLKLTLMVFYMRSLFLIKDHWNTVINNME